MEPLQRVSQARVPTERRGGAPGTRRGGDDPPQTHPAALGPVIREENRGMTRLREEDLPGSDVTPGYHSST